MPSVRANDGEMVAQAWCASCGRRRSVAIGATATPPRAAGGQISYTGTAAAPRRCPGSVRVSDTVREPNATGRTLRPITLRSQAAPIGPPCAWGARHGRGDLLRAAHADGDGAARGGARAPRELPGRGPAAQRARLRRAAAHRARAAELPDLRRPRAWIRARPLRRLRVRSPGRVRLQGPRGVPVVPRAADGRRRRAPGRSRAARPGRVLSPPRRVDPAAPAEPTRYHGVFAAHTRLRAGVTALVPGTPRPSAATPHPHREPNADRAPSRPPSRLPWAELLRRVFRDDLLVCPRCTGAMQVLATITDPDVVVAILTHLGAPTEPPAIAAARAPPQIPVWPGAFDAPADLDAYDPRRRPLFDTVPTCARPWQVTRSSAASLAVARSSAPPIPDLPEATHRRHPEPTLPPADHQTAFMCPMLSTPSVGATSSRRSRTCRTAPSSGCVATRGRATCASCATCSSVRSCSAAVR